jgi:hypothetical protein
LSARLRIFSACKLVRSTAGAGSAIGVDDSAVGAATDVITIEAGGGVSALAAAGTSVVGVPAVVGLRAVLAEADLAAVAFTGADFSVAAGFTGEVFGAVLFEGVVFWEVVFAAAGLVDGFTGLTAVSAMVGAVSLPLDGLTGEGVATFLATGLALAFLAVPEALGFTSVLVAGAAGAFLAAVFFATGFSEAGFAGVAGAASGFVSSGIVMAKTPCYQG